MKIWKTTLKIPYTIGRSAETLRLGSVTLRLNVGDTVD
jgi:hypothetical protein